VTHNFTYLHNNTFSSVQIEIKKGNTREHEELLKLVEYNFFSYSLAAYFLNIYLFQLTT